MKTLLHLLRKEVRYNFGLLLALWSLLAIYVIAPFGRFGGTLNVEGTPLSLSILLNPAVLIIPLLLTAVLVRCIHLDHPRNKESFLLTRPITPLMRWGPKILLWTLAAALPTCAAILLQLAVQRLDLHLGDYLRVTCYIILMLLACSGILAMLATAITHRQIVWVACLAALMVIPPCQQFLQAHPPARYVFYVPHRWYAFNLAAFADLASLGGFVYCAWVLSRTQIKTLLYSLSCVVIISLAAGFLWRWNYLERPVPNAVAPATSAELTNWQARTSVNTNQGYITAASNPGWVGPRQHGNIQCTFVQNAPHPLEWPRPLGGSANFLPKSQDSPAADPSSTPGPIRIPIHFNDPQFTVIQPASIIELLALPPQLIPALRAHQTSFAATSPYNANLIGYSSQSFTKSVTGHLDGVIQCAWYRPRLLASLRLHPGESFSHNGCGLTILKARLDENNRVALTLRIRRFEITAEGARLALENAPGFTLFLANANRGELALSAQTHVFPTAAYAFTDAKVVTLEYKVQGKDGPLRSLPPDWLNEARLHVMERVKLGETEQKFSAPASVSPW